MHDAVPPARAGRSGRPLAARLGAVSREGSRQLSLRVHGAAAASLPAALQLRLFQPGAAGIQVMARATGDGRYSAELPELAEGLWYVHPQTPAGARVPWAYVSFIRSNAAR